MNPVEVGQFLSVDYTRRLEVDPARSLSAHRVDWTNEAVTRVLWEQIKAEWALLEQYGLAGDD